MTTTVMHDYRFGCLFGGGGGMALGTQEADARFREHEGRFSCAGGYDYDADACRAFEYLTGCPETQLDATEATREDIWRIFGRKSPHAFWCSAPCKGGSPLVSDALASTPKYVAMNMLNYVGIRTVLDAYEGDEPAYFVLENVPNITSDARGAEMVRACIKLFKSRGYAVHHGYHEARHIGDLAQRRKRWFLVARLVRKVPVFLYRPPMMPGKVCRDVLGPMPLPGDPAGGPMNEVAGTSVMNLLRLWAIEAGEDWRSLIKGGKPEIAARAGVDLTLPEKTFHHVDRVTSWDDSTGAVTTSPAPSSGSPAVADPIELVGADANYFNGYLGVTGWADPTRAVIVGRGNGAHGVAAPVPIDLEPNDRFGDSLGVLAVDDASGAVTGRASATTGRFSIADPRPIDLVPQAGNRRMHFGKYSLARWDGSTRTVITASRVGSGALAVAQPIDLTATAFRDGYGVLRPDQEAGTVTANARVHTGAFSIAAPAPNPIDLLPRKGCFDAGYAVLSPDQPSRTIAATADVGCGAYAYAAQVPDVAARPALPQYVILTYEQTRAIVDGEVPIPFAVIDPERPEEPLAIVESLDKAPFRWEEHVVERVSKKGKVTRKTVRKKVVVALVLISRDGTWHRPLTTLELAALQGLRWTHRDGKPLDFGNGRTCDREIIGNMVPPPVARAMARQLLLSLLVADTVGFALGDAGTPIWVANVKRLERELKREGYIVVKGSRPMNFTTGAPLDDGAMRWKAAKKRSKKATPRAQEHVVGLRVAARDERVVHVAVAVQ